EASQAGNGNYKAAAPVDQTLVVEKADQTITFVPLDSPVLPTEVGPITLSATSTSGLPVTFSVISGLGSVSGNTLNVNGSGSLVVQASQAGDDNYNAAPDVQQTLIVESTLVVSTTDDVDDGNYTAGNLSLREAVALADSASRPETIMFDPDKFRTPQT